MKRFIAEADRAQITLLPESLDDYIDEANPVRAIDAFVAHLDLAELGFDVMPEATGRPGYHPSVLLRLFIYGYLNRIASSRGLEREAGRNLEVIWLLGRLVPDDKVIADFRKDNGAAIRKVCVRFVELCRQVGLLTGKRRHRWLEVQGGQQPRQELHAQQDRPATRAAGRERTALSAAVGDGRPTGPDGGPRHQDCASQGEAG
jgi:transposase